MPGAHPEHDSPAHDAPPPSETLHAVETEPIKNKVHAARAFFPRGPRLSQSEFITKRLHRCGAAGLDPFEIAPRHLSEPAHERRIYRAEKPAVVTWYWSRRLAHPLMEAGIARRRGGRSAVIARRRRNSK